MSYVIKTVKIGVHKEVHIGKCQAILDTQELYNQLIRFYMDFFVGHLRIFEERVPYTKKDGTEGLRPWKAEEILTFAETHTLDTKRHPQPLCPLMETMPSGRMAP